MARKTGQGTAEEDGRLVSLFVKPRAHRAASLGLQKKASSEESVG